MAINADTQAMLRNLQELTAPHDPGIMDYDPNDPRDAISIQLRAAISVTSSDGERIVITIENEDGHTETFEVVRMGTDANGQPIVAMCVSSDDELMPETAGLINELRSAGSRNENDKPADG